MGLDDVSKNPAPKADVSEVRKAEASDDSKFWDLFHKSSDKKPKGDGNGNIVPIVDDDSKNSKVTNLGAIGEFTLPRGWKSKGEHGKDDTAHVYNKEFVNPSADAKISISYRGTPIRDEAAKAFMDVLNQPEHRLSVDEFKAVSDVLRTRSSEANFVVKNAYTTTIDDQRVLMVEGQVPTKNALAGIDECVMYIPADRKGSVIQEVAYRAPHDTYGAYINTVKSAFENMAFR
jgi:hypothetical protein